MSVNKTEWKLFKYGVCFGPYFLVFSPNTGKYGPEETPYGDTSHEVQITIDVNKRYRENIQNMPDGCKLILSPFTGLKKQKAWSKTREEYMSEEGRQNLAEIDRRSYYKTRGMVRSILRR